MHPSIARRPRPLHLRVVPRPRDEGATPTWTEVSLSWGTTPLHVHHLKRPGGYVLADALRPGEDGFVVAASAGEAARLSILVERDGAVFARIPDSTSATLVVDGRVLFRREAQRASWLERDALHPGASLFRIERGRRCRFEARGLVVQIEGVASEAEPLNLRPRLTRADWTILAISAALHVAAIAAIVVTSPFSP